MYDDEEHRRAKELLDYGKVVAQLKEQKAELRTGLLEEQLSPDREVEQARRYWQVCEAIKQYETALFERIARDDNAQ